MDRYNLGDSDLNRQTKLVKHQKTGEILVAMPTANKKDYYRITVDVQPPVKEVDFADLELHGHVEMVEQPQPENLTSLTFPEWENNK